MNLKLYGAVVAIRSSLFRSFTLYTEEYDMALRFTLTL